MNRSQTWIALAALAMVAFLAAAPGVQNEVHAQQERPQLPPEVKTWLERDQMARWASLIETGRDKFAEGSCSSCHGDGGHGGRFAPDLTDDQWVQSDGGLEGIFDTIVWGVRERDFADPNRRFEMNPSGGMLLEWEDIGALAAYVWSLSNGDFLPRRGAPNE